MLALGLTGQAHAFTLSYGSGGAVTGDQSRYIRALVHEFKAAHPSATVEVEDSTSSYTKPLIDMLMLKDMGKVPDLAVIGMSEWPMLKNNELLGSYSAFLSEAEYKRVLAAIRPELDVQYYGRDFDAHKHGLPFNRSQVLLFVNTSLLPMPKSTVTWVELERMLSEARAKAPADAPKIKLSVSTTDWLAEAMLMNARGDSTAVGREVYLNDPAIRELIAILKRMRDNDLIELTPEMHDSYLHFSDGKVAAAMLSYSSYNSIVHRVPIPVRVIWPPKLEKNIVLVGGGDLVALRNPSKAQDAKTRRDLHDFIMWFYTGPGAGIWSGIVGYPPLTKQALKSPAFQERLAKRPQDRDIYLNPAKWKLHSMFRLDESCYTFKAGRMVRRALEAALATPDVAASLKQSEVQYRQIFGQPCSER